MFMVLLNPHGSDETFAPDRNSCYINELLNPHGSDETVQTAKSLLQTNQLLNPHGSDETHVGHFIKHKIATS